MTSSRISLAALLAVALVACGRGGPGDGGGSSDALPGPEQPNYNGQAPPSNDDAPTDSYGSPPNSYDQPGSDGPPGGGGSGGGGGTPPGQTGVCPQFCASLAAKGCDVGSSDECASDCSDALAEGQAQGCLNELVSLYECLLGGSAFVCTDGEVDLDDESLLAECESQVWAYAECSGQIEPEPGECTPDDACEGCVDECDYCLCLTGDDLTTCQTLCQ